MPRAAPTKTDSKLFTPEELAVLPAGMLDRAKAKQLAKKAKKKRAAAGRTEDELMLGFMGMGVEEPEPRLSEDERDLAPQRPSKKEKRQMKKVKAKQQAAKSNPSAPAPAAGMDVEEDAGMQKEADFAKFLSTMGGEWDADPRRLLCC
jgi:nuclear GTP-binding protein